MSEDIKAKIEISHPVTNNQILEVMNNGDLRVTLVTDEKQDGVKIKVRGVETVIGTQKPYNIVQVIPENKIEILFNYLKEQLDYQISLITPHEDLLKKHQNADPEKVLTELLKGCKNDLKKIGAKKLDKYAEILMDLETSQNMVNTYKPVIESLSLQVEFLRKNYGL